MLDDLHRLFSLDEVMKMLITIPDPVQKPLNGAHSLGAATAASLLLAVALQRLL